MTPSDCETNNGAVFFPPTYCRELSKRLTWGIPMLIRSWIGLRMGSLKNIHISIDEEMRIRMDRIGKPLGLNRSEIVRRALRDWLHRHAVESFEQEWINALQNRPDESKRAEDWTGVQTWAKK